jgi:beta-glucoside PTS system EIICBA component
MRNNHMKYEELAKKLVSYLGGASNISSSTHCVTRLRLQLKDDKIVDSKKVESLDGVLKHVVVSGQHQIVIGNHVSDVYAALMNVITLDKEVTFDSTKSQVDDKEKLNLIAAFIDAVSGIFMPVLGVMAAVGMIKGFCALFIALNWLTTTSGTYTILYTIGDGLFYFFPIVLGYSAANKFKCNPLIGMAIGTALVHPSLDTLRSLPNVSTFFENTIFQVGLSADFMGIPLMLSNYTSSVVPIIFAVYISSKIEAFLGKVIPSTIRTFFLPLLTLIIVVPVTFLVVGPVTVIISKGLGAATLGLIAFSPVLTGLFIGGLWQVFVIFGLHWGIIPIGINNALTLGHDLILPLAFGATFGQVGVAAAIFVKTKNEKLKSISLPAIISGLFGVTEPSIYGVTLPRKRAFVISCVIASLSGGILGYFGTTLYTMGGIGIFAYPSFIDPTNGIGVGLYGSIVASVFGLIAGFFAMIAFGKKSDFE